MASVAQEVIEMIENKAIESVMRVLISERVLVIDRDFRAYRFKEKNLPMETFQHGLERELRRA
jgi:hypothetical protein